jgi:hypothetical protein
MSKTPRPKMDPHGIAARFLRILTGLAVLAGFFSGASAAPRIADLTRAELDAGLAEENGPLRRFIATFEHAMVSGKIEGAEAMVDQDAILTRATQRVHFEGDETVRELFCDSTRRAWNERGVTRDFAGTRFRFLRSREFGGRAGLLFRSASNAGAVNYALFTVNQVTPGDYRVSDIFVVGLNEYMSDTLRRTWLNVAAGFLGEDSGEIKGVNPEYVAHIGDVAQASRLMNAGKYEQALKISRELPESVRRERSVLLVQIEAADRISTAARRDAYAAWLTAYPDEQELPLKLVEFYSSERRYDDAERVLRGLMERVGPDTLLKRELGQLLFRRAHEKAIVAKAAVSLE